MTLDSHRFPAQALGPFNREQDQKLGNSLCWSWSESPYLFLLANFGDQAPTSVAVELHLQGSLEICLPRLPPKQALKKHVDNGYEAIGFATEMNIFLYCLDFSLNAHHSFAPEELYFTPPLASNATKTNYEYRENPYINSVRWYRNSFIMAEIAIQVISPTAAHTHTVIFLHGRGDNVPSFIQALGHWRGSNGQTLAQIFPSFRWVFPQAPKTQLASFKAESVTQWFDVWDVRDFSVREELQAEGLRTSVPGIRALLEREAAVLGGNWGKVVLAGISQGAATSVHTLLNLSADHGLGAFLGFSCRLPFPGRTLAEVRNAINLEGRPGDTDNEAIRKTPVLLEHCVDDPLVLVAGGRNLRDTLMGYGAQVAWKEYPNGGHWFNSPTGVDDAVQFLRSVLTFPMPAPNSTSPGAMDMS